MKVLKLQIFNGTEMREWKVFDNPKENVIKIGTLPSSHIRLPGISRMHAVIENEHVNEVFRIIDLGGEPPTHVSGEKVRNALLRNGDIIHFGAEGPWSMRVTIEEGFGVEAEPSRSTPRKDLGALKARLQAKVEQPPPGDALDALKTRMGNLATRSKQTLDGLRDEAAEREREKAERQAPYRHQRAFDGLVEQLTALDKSESTARMIAQFKRSFERYDDAGKAEKLRALVGLLREGQQKHHFQEAMALGVTEAALRSMKDGSKVYDLSEDEATELALDSLFRLKEAKEGLDFLRNLPDLTKEANSEYMKAGHERIEQALTARTSTVLIEFLHLMTRAGGLSKDEFLVQQTESEGAMLAAMDQFPEGTLEKFPATILEYLDEIRERQAQ